MVAVVARVEAAGGIGTLEARGMYMSSVVAVGKGIPITLPVLTTTPSRLARLSPNRTPRLVSTPTYLHTTQRWLFLDLPVSLLSLLLHNLLCILLPVSPGSVQMAGLLLPHRLQPSPP